MTDDRATVPPVSDSPGTTDRPYAAWSRIAGLTPEDADGRTAVTPPPPAPEALRDGATVPGVSSGSRTRRRKGTR